MSTLHDNQPRRCQLKLEVYSQLSLIFEGGFVDSFLHPDRNCPLSLFFQFKFLLHFFGDSLFGASNCLPVAVY